MFQKRITQNYTIDKTDCSGIYDMVGLQEHLAKLSIPYPYPYLESKEPSQFHLYPYCSEETKIGGGLDVINKGVVEIPVLRALQKTFHCKFEWDKDALKLRWETGNVSRFMGAGKDIAVLESPAPNPEGFYNLLKDRKKHMFVVSHSNFMTSFYKYIYDLFHDKIESGNLNESEKFDNLDIIQLQFVGETLQRVIIRRWHESYKKQMLFNVEFDDEILDTDLLGKSEDHMNMAVINTDAILLEKDVQIGDLIVKIADKDVRGFSHEKLLSALRNAESPFSVSFMRFVEDEKTEDSSDEDIMYTNKFIMRHCAACHNTQRGFVGKSKKVLNWMALHPEQGYLKYAICLRNTILEMSDKAAALLSILEMNGGYKNYEFGSSVVFRAVLTCIMQKRQLDILFAIKNDADRTRGELLRFGRTTGGRKRCRKVKTKKRKKKNRKTRVRRRPGKKSRKYKNLSKGKKYEKNI